MGTSRLILQHRDDWQDVPFIHPKVEYLFDSSGGRGIESFDLWPEPSGQPFRVGYSGGLGPDNISRAVAFAEKHKDVPMWFDMESKLRTGSHFDINKVSVVCQEVWGDGE